MKTIAALLLLFAAACGSDAGSGASCSWSAQYDQTDAGYSGACVAARYSLSCSTGDDGEACLSADKTACPPTGSASGATSCVSQCHDDEYAIECGGPGVDAEPPASCRSLGALPSGTSFACCPCGS